MRFDGLGLPSWVDALPMLSARLLELTRGCLAQFESNHGAGLWWVRGTFSVARVQGAQNPINNVLVSGSPVGSTMGPLFSNKDVNKFTLCCRYCSRWDRMRRWRQCRRRLFEGLQSWTMCMSCRIADAYRTVHEELFRHCRIRIHVDRTQVWNAAGNRTLPACDMSERIVQGSDPEGRVQKFPFQSVVAHWARFWAMKTSCKCT